MKFTPAFMKDFGERLDNHYRLSKFPEATLKYKIFADTLANNDHMAVEKLKDFSEYSQELLHYNPHVEPLRREGLSATHYRKDIDLYLKRMEMYHDSVGCFIISTRMELFRKEQSITKETEEAIIRQRRIQAIDEKFMNTAVAIHLLKLEQATFGRAMMEYKCDTNRIRVLNAKRPVIE